MAKKIYITEQYVKDIAESIRSKNSEAGKMSIKEMANAIDNIETADGIAVPTGNLDITENGEYDIADYATVNVSVEGIIPEGNLDITENGEVDVTNYATVNVNVPEPDGSLDITENGEVDVTNYVTANVNVPVGITPEGNLDITENGEYDVEYKKTVNVNITSRADIHRVATEEEMNALADVKDGDICIIETVDSRSAFIFEQDSWSNLVKVAENS